MNRSRILVLLGVAAGLVAMLAIGVVLAQAKKPTASGMFPATLGDLKLASYVDGPAAVDEVRRLHGNAASVRIDNAYLVRYQGSGSDRARFWVSDSATAGEASSLLELMTARIASTGVFSQPTPVTVSGTTVLLVTGPPEMGLYNYFYARGRSVFWVQIDGADEARRLGILAEAVKQVTR